MAMLVAGLFLLGLQALAVAGWVRIHWEQLGDARWPFLESVSWQEQLGAFLTTHVSFAGWLALGFFLGFRWG